MPTPIVFFTLHSSPFTLIASVAGIRHGVTTTTITKRVPQSITMTCDGLPATYNEHSSSSRLIDDEPRAISSVG